MKRAKEHSELKDDFQELLDSVVNGDKESLNWYQEIILNILRVVRTKSFRKDIHELRKRYTIPSSLFTEKKQKKYDTLVFLHKTVDENLYKESMQIYNKWWDSNDSKIFKSDGDKDFITLATKYKLHPSRYKNFLEDYLFFGSLFPYIFTSFEYVIENELQYKAKLEFTPEDFKKKGVIGGYIRFFKDTSIDGLKTFIEQNEHAIKSLQQFLPEYPVSSQFFPGTFQLYLSIFLNRCLKISYDEIQTFVLSYFKTSLSENLLSKYASIFEKRISLSQDILE